MTTCEEQHGRDAGGWGPPDWMALGEWAGESVTSQGSQESWCSSRSGWMTVAVTLPLDMGEREPCKMSGTVLSPHYPRLSVCILQMGQQKLREASQRMAKAPALQTQTQLITFTSTPPQAWRAGGARLPGDGQGGPILRDPERERGKRERNGEATKLRKAEIR